MAITKHLNSAVLDGGLTYLINNGSTLHVVKNYVPSTHNYATTTTAVSSGGLSLGSVTINYGSITSGAGTAPVVPRYVTATPFTTITVAAGNTANGTSDDLGLVIVYPGGSAILASTDLTPDSAIAAGNVLTISAFNVTLNQPA